MRTLIPALLLIAACGGDKDGVTDDTGVIGDDDDTMGDDDDTMPMGGFDIEATALDVATQAPAAEGLCVDLLDPSPALTGGLPVLVLDTTVGVGGAVLFEDVVTTSTLGLLMSVKDCGTANTTVFTSATGISFATIDGLGEGDVVTGQIAFSITMDFLAGLQASAAAVGYTGDLATEGMMHGFVLDNVGTPISGATVSCLGCGTTYYMDADPGDGLYSTGYTPNAATDATAGASWTIPAGPIASYEADDGGAHTFEPQLNGSNPGSATITALYAD
jgi:hypothetical protein